MDWSAQFEIMRKEILIRWYKDKAFRQKLLTHPREALRESGYPIPKEIHLSVKEGGDTSITLVLPKTPAMTCRLSDADLEKVAGGGAKNFGFCDKKGSS